MAKYYNADVINPNGIDYVEIDNLINPPNSSNSGKYISFDEDGNPVFTETPAELPTVTAADNGKVLGVNNGAWGKMDVPEELPEVTAADNGKVLGVADGEWDVVEGGGGGSDLPTPTAADVHKPLVVHAVEGDGSVSYEYALADLYVVNVTFSDGSFHVDKTFAEITAAYNSGKMIIGLGFGAIMTAYVLDSSADFSVISGATLYVISVDSSDVVTDNSANLIDGK